MSDAWASYAGVTGGGLGGDGDVNGDGDKDFVMAVGTNSYLFFGPAPSGAVDLATADVETSLQLDASIVTIGDINDDSYDDLLISNGPSYGSNYLYFGGGD